VIGASGDGDGYAIGAGHLVHAFRRNLPFTYIVMNNETYGLTKGQDSPGRLLDHNRNNGHLDGPMLGASIPTSTFIARGYTGWFDQLTRLARMALEHARCGRGFAFLEIISPCVTYEDSYPLGARPGRRGRRGDVTRPTARLRSAAWPRSAPGRVRQGCSSGRSRTRSSTTGARRGGHRGCAASRALRGTPRPLRGQQGLTLPARPAVAGSPPSE
jgi:hypothetical protein